MLVLTRRYRESITIGDDIVITIESIREDRVRIGIKAPREIAVHRSEIKDRIDKEKAIQDAASEMKPRPSE